MKLYFPHYNQLQKQDCGPTCLKIISKFFGKTLDIQYLRDLCNISENGVTIANLSSAAESIGLRSMTFEVSFDQLIKKAILPCIAYIDNKHFVVIYKTTSKFIYISDPATKKNKYTLEYFKERFFFERENLGTIICFEPQPSFYNTDHKGKASHVPISYLRIVLKYLKQYKPQMIQLTITMFLVTIFQGLTPFIFRSVLDVGVDKKNFEFIDIMLIANIILVLSTALGGVIKDWIISQIGSRFSISIISNYLIKLLSMPLTYFNSISTGEVLNKVRDHENIKNFILYHFVNLSYSILSFTIFGLILYSFNLTIFSVFFGATILYIIWVISFKKFQEKLDWNTYYLNNKNQNFWVETVNNIQEIKSNNYEQKYRWKWEDIQIAIYHMDLRSLRIKNIQHLGSQVINGLKNIFITFICAKSVINGEMTFGIMISVQFITGFLNSPIHQFILFIQNYTSSKQSFLRLNEIHQVNFEKNIIDQKKHFIENEKKNILLNGIYLKYPGNNEYSLKNIKLIIPYGKTTAIVGKSGSGKSSLMKMILGLFDPSDGDFFIGSTSYKNTNMKQWRNKCGIVFQDGKIFNDTIINNIVLDDDDIDYNRVHQIIYVVELNEVLKELPNGYYSLIGEKGKQLSQGQKQRILLARALYRDPEYLFLDEATSALDVYNENKILNNITQLMKDKTLIIATHRINTIKNSDRIVVMNNAMIVEVGNHESLMNRKAVYFAMNALQDDQKTSNNELLLKKH